LSEVESVCDRVNIMRQGQLVLNETITALKEKNTNLETVFAQLTANS